MHKAAEWRDAEWLERIEQARQTIYAIAIETPVTKAEHEGFGNAEVYLKREDLQKTGSFKLRGAANKLLSLSDADAGKGVVTSSTGSHGLGVAASARHRGIDAEIFVSDKVSQWRLQRMEQLGARIRKVHGSPLDAELMARRAANDTGRVYVSPYNDPAVIAGQGTIGAELATQVPHVKTIYVSVGGGGLISGIGLYCKQLLPDVEMVACWAENSHVMYDCLRAGEIREFPEEPTVSEGTAGGVEFNSITFETCRRVIDRHVFASEQEILDAMRWAHAHGWKLEGAAALAVACAMHDSASLQDRTAVIVACGSNASPEVLARL